MSFEFQYSTRKLMEVVQGTDFKEPSYFRDRFFSNSVALPDVWAMYDRLPNGDRKIAPHVDRRLTGPTIERKGYDTVAVKPVPVSLQSSITLEDLGIRAPGHTEYESRSAEALFAKAVADALVYMEEKISRREELMCVQAIMNGELAMQGVGVNEKVQFWTQLDPSEQPVTTLASGHWNDAGTSVVDIMKSLESIVDSIVVRSNLQPTQLICGKNVYNALFEKLVDANQSVFDTRRVEIGNVHPQQRDGGISYLGHLNAPGIDILKYASRYEEGGVVKSMIDDNTCLLVSPKVRTKMYYGALPRHKKMLTGSRISWMEDINSLEGGVTVHLEAAPLPVLQAIDGFQIIKPLA